MVSFFPDEVEECQFYIPIENLRLYTLYNLIEGYSTFWSHAPVNPDKESKLADPLLDEVIAFWERQFLEEGDLKDTHMKCGETWDRIVHYSMEANDGLKEDVSRLEELDSTFLLALYRQHLHINSCYLHISFSYAMICSQVSHSGFSNSEKLSHIFLIFSICSFSS